MTERKSTAPAPAQPVANLAAARKEQAAARKGEAASKAAHPAGKQAPKPAAKKTAPAKVEAQKVTYAATGRGGVTRTQQSTSPLVAAVEACIANRRASHFAKGAVIAFYVSREKAQAACDQINAGNVADWSAARVVAVTVVTEAVSA